MRKILSLVLCLCMVFAVTGTVSAAETDKLVMKKILATDDAVEMVAPATIDGERARIQYLDAEKGTGGMKITFNSDKAGFKKLNINYDHAHKTGKAVGAMIFVNMADGETEGGMAVQWANNANGAWGRYQLTNVIIPVVKGTNTVRIASYQDKGGWQFYVDYVEISEGTYASKDDIPRRYIEAPRPKDIWDKIEAEIVVNNDEVGITDANGVMSVSMLGNAPFYYPAMDFGNGEVKSVELRYQGTGTWPYLQMRLDYVNGEIIAEGALPSPYNNDWTTTKINLCKEVKGSHKIYFTFVKGNASIDWFRFSKDVVYDELVPDPMNYRDPHMDTWVATDDLGRKTPTSEETGIVKKDKYVGMFYFLWHQGVNGELYDHNRAYQEGGAEALWKVMESGAKGYGHYWGEPYFGYYRTEDEWVIRKHAQMLVAAGVDFIFFDTSNSSIYSSSSKKILDVYKQMRKEGLMTPDVVFFMGTNKDLAPGKMVNMYYDFYKDGQYDDLWFYWDGKPLFLGPVDKLEEAGIADHFTSRYSWAFNSWTGDGVGKWPWIALDPQSPGKSWDGVVEQVTVACGFHANGSQGRSYTSATGQPTDGKGEFEFALETTPLGIAFDKQWETAHSINPKVVMLTGWNEWWAGRWENSNQWVANTYRSSETANGGEIAFKHYYVDCFNPEFSRDLEPMKGGFGDNYFYQTVQHVRQYKGTTPIPAAFGGKAIDLDGSFDQWSTVGPQYRDFIYDTTHRNSPANQGPETYVNTTGRNDIDHAKVSIDGNDIYFYVQTRENITAPTGKNWMNLYIDADQNASTGWHGYDYVINRAQNGKVISVEKNKNNAWEWQVCGTAECRKQGNEMHIKVSADTVGLAGKTDFDFKWADNSVETGDIMQFIDLGDAAPDGRFNFRYTQKNTTKYTSELDKLLEDGTVAMKVERPRAFAGKELSFIDNGNGNVVPTIINGRTVVPVRFISEKFGAQVSWNDETQTVTVTEGNTTIKLVIDRAEIEINGEKKPLDAPAQVINGRTFIPLRAMTEAIGKKLIWDPRGLILIGSQDMEASNYVLDEIENALN